MGENTNIEFTLRGLDGDRLLVISKEAALAISAGAEIIVDGGAYEVVGTKVYLSLTSSNCYLGANRPIMEIKPKAKNT